MLRKRRKEKIKKNADEETGEVLIRKNIQISEEVNTFAEEIDMFLSGDDYSSKDNESSLVVVNQFDYSEGGEFVYKPLVNFHLRLPNLEEKFRLNFSSYDSDESTRGVNRNRVQRNNPDESFGTSINWVRRFGKIDVDLRPRLEISPGVGVSWRLRFEQKINWARKMLFRPNLALYAKPRDGTGVFTTFNNYWAYSPKLTYILINEWEYQNKENLLQANNGFALEQLLGGDSYYFLHQIVFESTNRPKYHLDSIVVSSGFHHNWLYRVLTYKLSPYLSFEKENYFKGRAGIRLEVQMIF
ncbi:MAG: hypothetical protein VX642_09190 [Bdellovibrionota bacterium]|nr:hypothetical protein [Bdellovibrionota bacterium]